MASIFNSLYDIHPVLPLLYFAVLVNGITAPPIYCILQGKAVSYDLIMADAKRGLRWAIYAKYSFYFTIISSIAAVAVIFSTRP